MLDRIAWNLSGRRLPGHGDEAASESDCSPAGQSRSRLLHASDGVKQGWHIWLLLFGVLVCLALGCCFLSRSQATACIELATLFFAAGALSAVLTLLVRRGAPRLGLVDRPDTHRKLHTKATPLGGGIAIAASSGLVVAALLVLPGPWQAGFQGAVPGLIPLLLASLLIVVTGLVDDRIGLRGRHKLLGQCMAAFVLMWGGFVIHNIGMFGWHIELGLLSIPFTLFWLLGAINALNLLDGIDGLATTVGLILVSAIAGMAALTGHTQIAIAALLFAGCLAGFLPFNLPPATIFLGDAGSMLIGLAIGVLSIEGSLKGPGTVLLAAPLAIWTIPVFDSLVAILRRKLTGRTLYTTDRNHIHHRLLNRLGSNNKVLGLVGLACLVTGGAALIGVQMKNDAVALIASIAVVGVFVLSDLFGRVELLLLISRFRHACGGFLQSRSAAKRTPFSHAVHLQGSRNWKRLWESLLAMNTHPLVTDIRFDIHWPAAHEEFHARWQQLDKGDPDRQWRLEVPLFAVEGSFNGSVTVLGQVDGTPASADLEPVLFVLSEFEVELCEFVGSGPLSSAAAAAGLAGPAAPLAALRSRPR